MGDQIEIRAAGAADDEFVAGFASSCPFRSSPPCAAGRSTSRSARRVGQSTALLLCGGRCACLLDLRLTKKAPPRRTATGREPDRRAAAAVRRQQRPQASFGCKLQSLSDLLRPRRTQHPRARLAHRCSAPRVAIASATMRRRTYPSARSARDARGGGMARGLFGTNSSADADHRTTRAEPPPTSRWTSGSVAIDVSPGVVMASAPWATP